MPFCCSPLSSSCSWPSPPAPRRSSTGPTTAGTIGRANLDGTGVDRASSPAREALWGGGRRRARLLGQLRRRRRNTIGRANLDGTGVDQSFITGPTARGVAVDAAHVYWANVFDHKTIGRANLDGTGVDQSFITGASSPAGVAVDAAHVYWTNDSDFEAVASARSGAPTSNGTGVDQSFIARRGLSLGARGVAVDAAHVYWANSAARSDAPTSTARARPELHRTGAGLRGGGRRRARLLDNHWLVRSGAPTSTARASTRASSPARAPVRGGGRCAIAARYKLPNFSFGKLKKNNNKGTAKLTLEVPAPGEIALAKTKKVKDGDERPRRRGMVKLSVKPSGKAKKKLNRRARPRSGPRSPTPPTAARAGDVSKKIDAEAEGRYDLGRRDRSRVGERMPRRPSFGTLDAARRARP